MSRILFGFDEEIQPVAIASAEAFGRPQIALFLAPTGIPSGESVGTPSVTHGARPPPPAPAPYQSPYQSPAAGGGFFAVGSGGGGAVAAWNRDPLLERDVEKLGLGDRHFRWPKEAEKDEARRALRKVASWMHPDVVARLHPEAREQIEERFRDLTEAYEALRRREKATRGRQLATATTDPAWDDFLRNLKPTRAALVPEELATRLSEVAEATNAAETVEDILAPPKKKRKKKRQAEPPLVTYPLSLATNPMPMFYIDQRPLISGTTLALAAIFVASFGAGWLVARTIDRTLVRLQYA